MFTLEKLNVVRVVDSKTKAEALEAEGFTLVSAQAETVVESSEESNYEKMTITELKDFAAEKGIDLGKLAKKADIVQAVVSAQVEAETEVVEEVKEE